MEQYINKSALVAKIERLQLSTMDEYGNFYTAKAQAEYNVLSMLKIFIDTIETKEVDLEKELENLIEKEKAFVTDDREVKYYNGDSFNHIYELEFIAKYFFELGLKK